MKVGRNDPCPCGSGKKYKKCCSPKFDAPPSLPVSPSLLVGNQWRSNMTGSSAREYTEPSRWPVVWVQAPLPEVWAVTGVGFAGVVRASSEERAAHAGFALELLDGGVKMLFGKPLDTRSGSEAHLIEMRDRTGPAGPSDLATATTFVRACLDFGRSRGDSVAPGADGFLLMLGAAERSMSFKALTGVGGLHPTALVELVDAHAHLSGVADGAELAIFSAAEFVLADPPAAIEALRRSSPDFDAHETDGKLEFEFTRPSKPGQRSPLSRIPGRRVQGTVTIEGDRLLTNCGALTMSAKLLDALLRALPERPWLAGVSWTSPNLKQSWSWDAEDEPLALHQRTVEGG